MSLSPAPSSTPEPLFARDHAIRLGMVLLVGFAVIIALTGYDASRRDKLETFEEVTAVGDRDFFPIPAEVPAEPAVAVMFQGKPLIPVSYEPLKASDAEMGILGTADGAPYRIYESRKPPKKGDDEDETLADEPGTKSYYLKVEPDRFLKLRPGK